MTRSDAVCLLGGALAAPMIVGGSSMAVASTQGVTPAQWIAMLTHAPYALPSYLFVSLIGCGLGAVLATRRAMPKPMPRSGEALASPCGRGWVRACRR